MNNFGVRRQRIGIDSLQIIGIKDANANAVVKLKYLLFCCDYNVVEAVSQAFLGSALI